MRKIFLLILAFVAMLFAGCQSDVTAEGGDVVVVDGKTILTVTMPETRTYLGNKHGGTYPVYWSNEDKICVNNNLSSKITISDANRSSAKFEFSGTLNYPFYISHSYDYEYVFSDWLNISHFVSIDPAQYESEDEAFAPRYLPMYGIVEKAGDPVKLQHLSGILRIAVKAGEEGQTLSKITVKTASGEPLSGLYIINPICGHMYPEDDEMLSDGNLTPCSALEANYNSNKIVYYCDTSKPLSASKEREFFITVPEGSHGACTVTFTLTTGEKMLCNWSNGVVNAGIVKEFKPLTFKVDEVYELEAMEAEDGEFDSVGLACGYVIDNKNRPIEGVAVSDGFSVVQTDAKGYYELSPSPDTYYISVSIPSEYEVPINEHGQPCFYKRYYNYMNKYNFVLTPLAGGKEEKFALFAIADPQIWEDEGFNRLKNEAIPGIYSHCNEIKSTMPCYGITLGDIISSNPTKTGDASEYREPIREQFSNTKVGMPVFHVMGNHDNTYAYHGGGIDPKPDANNSTWQIKMQRDHEAVFGPANYSFDRGDVHIVGMRNIEYYLNSNNEYSNRIGFLDEQVEWLKQDLALVPKEKMVVLCVHIPFADRDNDNATAILDMLKAYPNAHILSGHTHYNRNYLHESTSDDHPVYEHVVSALCGSWWDSNITMDGTPVGYQVFVSEGNRFADWYYMGYTSGMNTRSHQMRLYRGDALTGGAKSGTDTYGVKGYYKFNFDSNILLANVYNADSDWKIEVYEDGVYSGDMTLIPNKVRPYHTNDPATSNSNLKGNGTKASPYYSALSQEISSDMHFAGLYLGILGKKDKAYNTYGTCYHMYKYALKNKNANIEVRATDRFGRVYTETKITTGTDYSITGL